MTCWGYGILESDTAEEAKALIYQALETRLPSDADLHVRFAGERMRRLSPYALDAIEDAFTDDLELSIAMCTLAEVFIANRVQLTAGQVTRVKAPILHELDNIREMGWDDPEARKEVLTQFLRRLEGLRPSRMQPTGNAPSNEFYRYELGTKFWEIRMEPNGRAFTTRWGRIGNNPRSLTKSYPSTWTARDKFRTIINSKLRKGYARV